LPILAAPAVCELDGPIITGPITSKTELYFIIYSPPNICFHLIIILFRIITEICKRVIPFYIDRKSTRLNSSHVSISYAVFCLKKKKITPQTLNPHDILEAAHRTRLGVRVSRASALPRE